MGMELSQWSPQNTPEIDQRSLKTKFRNWNRTLDAPNNVLQNTKRKLTSTKPVTRMVINVINDWIDWGLNVSDVL